MTERLANWQWRLGELLDARRRTPFAWGSNDCCTFAADCVLAVTGVDPGAGLRDYSTEKEAVLSLRKYGGVGGVGDALFGAPVGPLLARVGDVGVVAVEGRESLAVCNGSTWIAAGKFGTVALPMQAASRAWRF